MGWILLAVLAVAAFGVMGIYNQLVQTRVQVKEGWSGIDVQLKRRHDLIPNLVETVKGYMQHERGTLEKVTQLRSQVTGSSGIEERAGVENQITQALKTIFAVAENYPELKANQNFVQLQGNLNEIENEIQLARRYYNGTVRNLNVMVQAFPSNLVAQVFHFEKADFFEVEAATERAVPEVKF